MKNSRSLRFRRLRDERGAVMVEFALVAPLLFVLLFGIVDFGRALNYWLDQTHLAAEGARLAAVDNGHPGSCPSGAAAASLQQYVQCQADTKELLSGGTPSVPKGAKVCITFPNGTANVGDPVTVTVSSDFNWMPILNIGASTGMSGSATTRIEAAPTTYSAGCYQP